MNAALYCTVDPLCLPALCCGSAPVEAHPVKTTPNLSHVHPAMLRLCINLSDLQLARISSLWVPLEDGSAPGMLLILSFNHNPFPKHSSEAPPSPFLWFLLSCVFSSRSCQASCVTRMKKKKHFGNPLARESRIYFWSGTFFCFFFVKTKNHREKAGWRRSGSHFPRQRHYYRSSSGEKKKGWLHSRREVFFLQSFSRNSGLSSCHLATIPTCFPLQGHLLALLCFDLFRPFFQTFVSNSAVIKLRHLNSSFVANSFASGWAQCGVEQCYSIQGSYSNTFCPWFVA